MNWLYGYLAVGFLVFLVVIGSHLIQERRNPSLERRLREITGRRKDWRQRAIEWIIAPVAAVIVWPVLVLMGLKSWWSRHREDGAGRRDPEKAFEVTREHLLQVMAIGEIEAAERVYDPLGAVPDLPFGHLNPHWERFKARLEPGDELWRFSAPWREGSGKEIREGYAVVRGEEIGPWFPAGRKAA